MSARRIVLQAALAAVAIAPALAQEPATASPPPRQAVERTRARDDGGVARTARVPERRIATAPTSMPEARPRLRAVAPISTAPAAALEQQGGRRNPSAGGGGGGSRGGGGGRVGGSSGGGSRGGSTAQPRGGGRRPSAGGASMNRAIPRAGAPRPPVDWGNGGRRFYRGATGLGYYVYDPFSWYGWGWPGYGPWGAWNGGFGGPWGGFYGNNWGGYYGNNWGGGWGGGSLGVYGGPYGWSIGGVRIKVAERDAEVYVDGYYAGTVNDFDGIWQQLRLDDGAYRLEIRKPGFEALTFDVRIQPGRTITYRGTMQPAP